MLRECGHRLPFQSQMRMIASQKRSPKKTAAKAQTPTVARKINEPVIKDWLNCSARETPEKTPNTAPQVSCIQKLPRPWLCFSGVIARKRPTKKSEPPPTRGVNRDSGSGSAQRRSAQVLGSAQRIIRVKMGPSNEKFSPRKLFPTTPRDFGGSFDGEAP